MITFLCICTNYNHAPGHFVKFSGIPTWNPSTVNQGFPGSVLYLDFFAFFPWTNRREPVSLCAYSASSSIISCDCVLHKRQKYNPFTTSNVSLSQTAHTGIWSCVSVGLTLVLYIIPLLKNYCRSHELQFLWGIPYECVYSSGTVYSYHSFMNTSCSMLIHRLFN